MGATLSIASLMLAAAGVAGAQEQGGETLYDRLGGVYRIAALADDFVDRLLADEVVLANPYVAEARGRIAAPGLKFQLTAMLCAAAGGPEKYAGAPMREAHAHLRITGRQFQAAVADLEATLGALSIGAAERAELARIVAATRAEIVSAGELDGLAFSGEALEGGGARGAREEISFANGRLVSSWAGLLGFEGAVYTATADGETTAFAAAGASPGGGTISWKGTVRGQQLEAVVTVAGTAAAPFEARVRAGLKR